MANRYGKVVRNNRWKKQKGKVQVPMSTILREAWKTYKEGLREYVLNIFYYRYET